MRFSIFYEHQLPRPWDDGAEARVVHEALEQVQLADKLGFSTVWEVEHHFLEEYSHSSAPEVFLSACAATTKNIHIGHGIVPVLPGYNHPARVAERISTLDIISNGRVEFGTGETSSDMELLGFELERADKRSMWEEAVPEIAKMMSQAPYEGHTGRFFSMPARNVVPKPVQRPHPPIWVACSQRDTILMAGSRGIGALSFAFINPDEARQWVADYYAAFEACTDPVGLAPNPNIAVTTGFLCHQDELIFVSQAGRNRHEDICESMELFAKEVMPEFAERAPEVEAAKRERYAETIERLQNAHGIDLAPRLELAVPANPSI